MLKYTHKVIPIISMSRSRESLPPTPFVEGTTYYGNGRDPRLRSPLSLVNEVDKRNVQDPTQDENKPRIARIKDIAKSALNNIPPETNAEKEAEEEHLKRLFAFPDESDDRMFMRTSVTQERLSDALDAYIVSAGKDKTIEKIISQSNENGLISSREVAKVLRSNNELRLELGAYLLRKVDSLEHLPRRLIDESEVKRPNIQGYDEVMTSKEYAVLLAISMLDGTYKHSSGDQIIEGKYGDIEAGQHRYTALRLLDYDSRIYRYTQKK